MEHKRPPEQEFFIGDIVEIAGSWASDWKGEKQIIGQIYWSLQDNMITYGTYPADADIREGLTDEWPEHDLKLVEKSEWRKLNGL